MTTEYKKLTSTLYRYKTSQNPRKPNLAKKYPARSIAGLGVVLAIPALMKVIYCTLGRHKMKNSVDHLKCYIIYNHFDEENSAVSAHGLTNTAVVRSKLPSEAFVPWFIPSLARACPGAVADCKKLNTAQILEKMFADCKLRKNILPCPSECQCNGTVQPHLGFQPGQIERWVSSPLGRLNESTRTLQ
jgi:hypothetical protein